MTPAGTALACAAVVWVLGGTGAAAMDAGRLRATNLRCEYLRDPLGVEERSPRLGWVVESDRRGEVQTAYRVLVASSQERLARDEGDLWDSGKVLSDETAHVEYRGAPLASRQACFWKVRSWDRDGEAGDWSAPARLEMGLLAPEDWSAAWIEAGSATAEIEVERAVYYSIDGAVRKDVTAEAAAMVARGEPIVASNGALGGDPAYGVPKRLTVVYRCGGATLRTDVAENAQALLARERYPYLRRSFDVSRPVAQARLYATALGVYEAYLNGDRVGDGRLTPGWTDYRARVRYQVYDVTDRIRPGENVIGAMVGPGWFSGRAGLFQARAFYGQAPAFLAQLEITYADGSTERIVTDAAWKRHDGPIMAADLMDGEVYDARAEIDGWSGPGLDDSAWTRVSVRAESRRLEGDVDLPIRQLAELPAVSVSEPEPGRWTFDLGQNMVGVVRLRVRCEPGTVLTVRHAEMLNPDGTIYTANLRAAAATDTYICKGGVEEWQPRFTFHGFRYVEVTGFGERPGPEAVTGIVLASDLIETGEFVCSDERINRLQANIAWGLRGNFVSIPTDCPQRDERMGWTGDAQAFAPTAAYNADIAPFMTKWLIDLADAQRDDGAHSDVAPAMRGLSYGTPAWADAGVIVPWAVHQAYGDARILERHAESMIRWVEWCRTHSTGLIRDHARGNDYGDWLSIGADTPKDMLGTAYFAHSTDLLARSLHAIGRDEEAARYERLFEDVRRAFVERYVDSQGRVAGETQTGYVLALRFGLVPDELRAAALDRLVADIEGRGWRLSTGFVGVGHLLHALSDGGRDDVAYRLLVQDEFPSWLFSVKHGATTIWERWDGWTPERGFQDPGMNSFNHYALGSCGRWLFECVGGIEPDPQHPGFARFVVRPRTHGPLTWANTTYRSIRGEIATRWRRDGDRLTLAVTIPSNTAATVYMPAAEGSEVLESGRRLDTVDGVRVLRRERATVVLSVGSGRYEFTSSRAAQE
ncbi:MAG: family 78 glycoside hydrolase catalytic domain [Phycisphaerales bacterium]|nr:family 78 glycoside hydrolase catalytic domain [Phycisphaerales bacterium]